jgi:hypothetical protein
MDGDPNKQIKRNITLQGSNGYDVIISLLILSTFWLRWLIRPNHEVDRFLLGHRWNILPNISWVFCALLLFTQIG